MGGIKVIFGGLMFLIFFYTGSAQQYEYGSFEFGVLGYSLKEGGEVDSSSVNKIINMTNRVISDRFYFSSNKIAGVTENMAGDGFRKRIILDFSTNILYTFDEIPKWYQIDTINHEKANLDYSSWEEIERYPLSKKVFGFSVDSVLFVPEKTGDTIAIITTSDINFTGFPGLMLFSNGNEIGLRSEIPFGDARVIFGFTSFSTDIKPNDKLFSTSLTGYKDGKLIREEFGKKLEGDKSYKDPPYEGQGINLDKINALFEDNVIDSSSVYNKRLQQEWIENQVNFDNHSVLQFLKSDGNPDYLSSSQDILNVIQKYRLIANENTLFLENVLADNSGINEETFWRYIFYAQIKAELSYDSIRQNIVNNHLKLGYDLGGNEAARSKFIENEIDFSQYAISVSNSLYPLIAGITTSIAELQGVVELFMEIALDDITDFSIENTDTSFVVKTTEYEYIILFKDVRSIDWTVTYDDKAGYSYSDTTMINENLYETLLNTIQQIKVDYQSPFCFGIYDFDEMVIGSYYTSEITMKYPEMKMFEHRFALNKFIHQEYKVYEFVPFSFPHNQHSLDRSFLFLPPYDAGVNGCYLPYITSAQKRNFVTYFRDNIDSYELTSGEVDNIDASIKNRLVENLAMLLTKIPQLTISVTRYVDNRFYEGAITDVTDNFRSLFPQLHKLTKGAFVATDFIFENSLKPTLSFNYNNERYIMNVEKRGVFKKMAEFINNKSIGDKRLYKIPFVELINYKKDIYLYRTAKEIKSLEEVLGIQFEKM